jgi:hypothetical protein
VHSDREDIFNFKLQLEPFYKETTTSVRMSKSTEHLIFLKCFPLIPFDLNFRFPSFPIVRRPGFQLKHFKSQFLERGGGGLTRNESQQQNKN